MVRVTPTAVSRVLLAVVVVVVGVEGVTPYRKRYGYPVLAFLLRSPRVRYVAGIARARLVHILQTSPAILLLLSC